jgi:hypothetical protein
MDVKSLTTLGPAYNIATMAADVKGFEARAPTRNLH